MDSRTKQAIVRKAVKRIEDETSLAWLGFPGLAKEIALIVLEVTDEKIDDHAQAA